MSLIKFQAQAFFRSISNSVSDTYRKVLPSDPKKVLGTVHGSDCRCGDCYSGFTGAYKPGFFSSEEGIMRKEKRAYEAAAEKVAADSKKAAEKKAKADEKVKADATDEKVKADAKAEKVKAEQKAKEETEAKAKADSASPPWYASQEEVARKAASKKAAQNYRTTHLA